jgi:hypothetical protein
LDKRRKSIPIFNRNPTKEMIAVRMTVDESIAILLTSIGLPKMGSVMIELDLLF